MATNRIRELNDAFRTTFGGGQVMLTAGIEALPLEVQMPVMGRVMTFSEFTPDNDPHGEHDFGSFELAGYRFFFKIDFMEPCYAGSAESSALPVLI